MGGAKNKLQDIYNTAIARLGEIEFSQRKTLEDTCGKYREVDSEARCDLSKGASTKQELLSQEIQAFFSNSVGRIQSAVEMQCTLTNNMVARSTQRLVAAAQKLEDSLARSQTRNDQVQMDGLDDVCARFSAFVDQSLMRFREFQNESSRCLRDKHAHWRSALEQSIVSSVAILRQHEHEFTLSAQSSAAEQVAGLRSEAERLNEQLRSKHQQQIDSLRDKLTSVDTVLDKHHKDLVLDAEAHAKQTSHDIELCLERVYVAPDFGQPDALLKQKSQLKSEADTGTSALVVSLDAIRNDIAKSAEQRLVQIDGKAKEVRGRIDSMVETLEKQLNSHLQSSLNLERELEDTNAVVVCRIEGEFIKQFESFKEKMENALTLNIDVLDKAFQDAQHEISGTHGEIQAKIQTIVSEIQSESDRSLAQILARVRQARQEAVQTVQLAGSKATMNNGGERTHDEETVTERIMIDEQGEPNVSHE